MGKFERIMLIAIIVCILGLGVSFTSMLNTCSKASETPEAQQLGEKIKHEYNKWVTER